jgi:hypothetical protein
MAAPEKRFCRTRSLSFAALMMNFSRVVVRGEPRSLLRIFSEDSLEVIESLKAPFL